MITLKDSVVTITGDDLVRLENLASKLGLTPEDALLNALESALKRDKKLSKDAHVCDNSFADEMYHLSGKKYKNKRLGK